MNDQLGSIVSLLSNCSDGESVRAFASILETMPNCVIVTDASPDYNCLYVNRAARRALRQSLHRVSGRPLHQVVRLAERDRLLATLRLATVNGDAAYHRFRPKARSRDGRAQEPGDITGRDWRVYPMKDVSGVVRQLILIVRERRARPRWLNGRGLGVAGDREPRALLRVVPGGLDEVTEQLTSREWEVAELVAQGLTNVAIAQQLFLSRATVATYVARLLDKLDATSRVRIAAWVIERRPGGQTR
jgi:DNA-binding CsgD family transcriptional regulator